MNQFVLVALCVMSLNGVFTQNQIFLTNQDTYYPSYIQGNIEQNQMKVDYLNLPGIDFPQGLVYSSSAVAGQDPIWTDNINLFPLTYQTNGLSFVSPASNIDQQPVQHQHLPFGHENQHRLQFIKNGLHKLRNHQTIGEGVQQIQHGFQNSMNSQVLDQRVQRIQNDHQNPMSPQVLVQGVEPMMDSAAIQPADNPLDQPKIPNLAKNSVNKQPDSGTIAKSLNFKPKDTNQESLQTQYVTKTQPSIGKSGLKSKPVEMDKNLQDKSANDASYQQQLQQEQQLVDLIRQEQDKLLRIKLQQAEIKIKQEELIRNQLARSQKPMGQMERNLPMQQSMQQNIPVKQSMQQNTPAKQSMQQNTPMQQQKQSRQRFGLSQTSIQRLGQQKLISSQNHRNTQQQQNSPTPQQIQEMQPQQQQLMIQQRQIQQLQQRLLEQMKRQQLLEQEQSLNIKRERLQRTIKDRQSLQSSRYMRRRQRIQPINFLP